MPLDETQLFLEKNFRKHAKLCSAEILRNMKGNFETELVLYGAIMSFVETAFRENKIIIKSSQSWDELENG